MRMLDLKLLRDFRRMWPQAVAIGLVVAGGVASLVMSVGSFRSLDETRAAYYERYQYWPNGERYGRSMINDFNSGAVAWTDWNILLDEHGGPNHVGNYCFAPIHADLARGELVVTPPYWYIGHFSKFIRPGARRIGPVQVAVRVSLSVELDQVARGEHHLDEPGILLIRAVAPINIGGLGERDHVGDPGDQFRVFDVAWGADVQALHDR
jgi:hypothetical protein